MAAMMLPTALPMIQTYAQICRQRHPTQNSQTVLFIFAYLLVWFLFSIILTSLQNLMLQQGWLSGSMMNQNALVAGGILIISGLYQFTNLKNICLKHCRTPIGFLLNAWQDGKSGAFNLGLKHGLYCLGCCWAQMLLMFAGGVMNLLLMVFITLLIFCEKTIRIKVKQLTKITGLVFILWGGFLLTLGD